MSFPSYVAGDGEPYRPTVVLWVEPSSGLVIDSQLVRPEEALSRAAGLFHLATREPHAGEPRMPRRIRVADEALAHALRGAVGDVEVVVAATPEMDEVVASLHERFVRRGHAEEEDDAASYLGPGIATSDVACMFAAAARLYRAQPWSVVPSDGFVSVRCEQLGIEAGALSVVGQMGESFGFSLFRTVEDACVFLEAADARARGEVELAFPRHWMFMFDDRRELPEPLLREIARERWEVAGPRAYPSCMVIDADLVSRALTRDELDGMSAIVAALAELVETSGDSLADACHGGEAVEHATAIPTPRGDVMVTIGAPLFLPLASDVPDEEAARWESVLDEDGRFDEVMFEHHRDAFLDEFLNTVEDADDLLGLAEVLVEYAAVHFGATLVGLSPAEMKKLLFEVIPRKFSVGPEAAAEIVETLRALLLFADGALESRSAAKCLAALDAAALARLEKELANDNKFGMAKRLFMAGSRAGFDLSSEAGLAAFVSAVNAGTLAVPVRRGGKAKPKTKTKTKAKAETKAETKTKAKAETKATARTKPKTNKAKVSTKRSSKRR